MITILREKIEISILALKTFPGGLFPRQAIRLIETLIEFEGKEKAQPGRAQAGAGGSRNVPSSRQRRRIHAQLIQLAVAIYTRRTIGREVLSPTISIPAPPPEGKPETLVLHWFALFPSLGTLGEDRTNQVSSWLNFPPLLSLKDPRRGSSLLMI
ncbi:hypothetical protein EJB05_12675, partial [Eragrostis curvula]